MVRNDLTGIKLKQTTEPLTGQGGFLAFGEYLRGGETPGAGGGSICRLREATGGLGPMSLFTR